MQSGWEWKIKMMQMIGTAWHGNSGDIQISNGRVSLKTAADLCGWHGFMLWDNKIRNDALYLVEGWLDVRLCSSIKRIAFASSMRGFRWALEGKGTHGDTWAFNGDGDDDDDGDEDGDDDGWNRCKWSARPWRISNYVSSLRSCAAARLINIY